MSIVPFFVFLFLFVSFASVVLSLSLVVEVVGLSPEIVLLETIEYEDENVWSTLLGGVVLSIELTSCLNVTFALTVELARVDPDGNRVFRESSGVIFVTIVAVVREVVFEVDLCVFGLVCDVLVTIVVVLAVVLGSFLVMVEVESLLVNFFFFVTRSDVVADIFSVLLRVAFVFVTIVDDNEGKGVMMCREEEEYGPLVKLVCGVLLVNLPVVAVVLGSFFAEVTMCWEEEEEDGSLVFVDAVTGGLVGGIGVVIDDPAVVNVVVEVITVFVAVGFVIVVVIGAVVVVVVGIGLNWSRATLTIGTPFN